MRISKIEGKELHNKLIHIRMISIYTFQVKLISNEIFIEKHVKFLAKPMLCLLHIHTISPLSRDATSADDENTGEIIQKRH